MSSRVDNLDITLLRRLASAPQASRPDIFVHDDAVWRTVGGSLAPLRIDSYGNLHMAMADLLMLRNLVPVKDCGRIRADVRKFQFDLHHDHLLAGVADRGNPVDSFSEAKRALRAGTGHDPDGRKAKPKLKYGGIG